MYISLFMLPRRAKHNLPVTSSDTWSIQLLVDDGIAHGKDTMGEIQKATLRDKALAGQVKEYRS